MGKTLRSYVVREILGAVVAGLALFSFVLFLARILDLVDLVIASSVPMAQVARLFAYVVPSFLEVSIPAGALLGVVVAFARFSSDGELLAMRTAGLSLWQLARPALVVGLITGAATLIVAGWARPWAQRHIGETVYEIAKTRAAAALRPRVFTSLFDGLVLYADRIEQQPQRLEGVLLSDERDADRRTTVFAESARMIADERSKIVYLRLTEGTSVTYHTEGDSYDTTAFASFEVNIDVARGFGAAPPGEQRPPEQLYLNELAALQRVRASEPAAARTAAGPAESTLAVTLELHRRLAFAAASVLLALMGVPLGMQPSHAVRARGLAVSLLVVIGYYVLFTAALGLAHRGLMNPALAMWMPNAVVAALVLLMLSRAASDRLPYPTPAALAHVFTPAGRFAAS